MRALIQRVKRAKVTVGGKQIAWIGEGMLLLLGIRRKDTPEDVGRLVDKVVNLRIFEDEAGKMNLSLKDTGGELLVVPQFTLYANTRKGRRPSFEDAMGAKDAQELFEEFIRELERRGFTPRRGRFGEHMVVSLDNDGPVTIIIDTEEKF